jgi:hypothetical protein
MIKDISAYLKVHHIIAFVGAIVLIIALYQYSSGKSSIIDKMTGRGLPYGEFSSQSTASSQDGSPMNTRVVPDITGGNRDQYSSVSGISTTQGMPPSNTKVVTTNPNDLLPLDVNSQWSKLNPNGNSELANVNLLKAGFYNGIDTIGSSLRNANLQIRSEPPNPTTMVSPWMQSTIEPDLMRVPLEIGAGSQ